MRRPPLEPFKLTVDNLESQVATDHISPFLLTKLLAPKILAARSEQYTPRVVFVSSVGHGLGTGVNFDTLGKPDPASYVAMDAYYQAKAANVLSAIELSKRSKGQINVYSLHPGAIFTNITQKGDAIAGLQSLGYLDSDGQPSSNKDFKTMAQGAATTVTAALDPRLNDSPGAYLEDCNVANDIVAPHCSDPANAEKLWTLTEQIVGESFVF
ncbi:Short-chain dehydrogenase/reductase family protein [Mycena venus]|uniref:Short-chain dehydrogenase/reductase family protein n=1 Tax=Mycena venus TaxID=2733690 RepID=A0A8H6YUR8_9AGAR|nr:Short-chain dehydrogenase/reductase family protein [Mycena venus]